MIIEIKVHPKAKKKMVRLDSTGKVNLYILSAPTDGKANEEVIAYIAALLHCPKNAITIVRGQQNRNKQLTIQNWTPESFRKFIGDLPADSTHNKTRKDAI